MAEETYTYHNTPEAAKKIGWTHDSVREYVHGDPKSKYVHHDHVKGEFHYTNEPGNLRDHNTLKPIKEEIVNEIEDDTKRYLEPKAPSEKAQWVAQKIRRYTQPGIPQHQFDGGTKKFAPREGDVKDTRVDNAREVEDIMPSETPAYLTTIKNVIAGVRESEEIAPSFVYPDTIEESNVFKAMAAANKARIKAEREAAKAHAKEHQKKQAADDKAKNKVREHIHANQIASSVADHFPDTDGYDHARHTLIHHHGVPAHKVDDHIQHVVRKHLGAKSFDDYVEKAHKNYHSDTEHRYDPNHPNYHKEEAEAYSTLIAEGFPLKDPKDKKKDDEKRQKKQSEDRANGDAPKPESADDAEAEAEDKDAGNDSSVQNVSSGAGGTEVKNSLEQLALQAAELFAEVDEKQAFDSEIKDALETAVEALGKVHSVIMGQDAASDDDEDNDDQNAPDYKENDGGDENKPFQKEDVTWINELSKNTMLRYIGKAAYDTGHEAAKGGAKEAAGTRGSVSRAFKHYDKANNRARGVVRAAHKIAGAN